MFRVFLGARLGVTVFLYITRDQLAQNIGSEGPKLVDIVWTFILDQTNGKSSIRYFLGLSRAKIRSNSFSVYN